MYVLSIFPITKNEKNIPLILEEFKQTIAPTLHKLGAEKIEIRFPPPDYTYVPSEGALLGTTKGKGILDVLKNTPVKPDYILVCDGSGKIPYSKTIEMFRELVSDSSINCIMANRIGQNKAISPIRYFIECWEVYLLRSHFNYQKEIPDGQCGLWGFYAKEIKGEKDKTEIFLSAEGYDIEIDLLSECLEKEIEFSFVDVELKIDPATITTLFTPTDNIKKMKFLLNKYPMMRGKLISHLTDYTKLNLLSNFQEDEQQTWKEYCSEIKKLAQL